jgi:hypothetical protein
MNINATCWNIHCNIKGNRLKFSLTSTNANAMSISPTGNSEPEAETSI